MVLNLFSLIKLMEVRGRIPDCHSRISVKLLIFGTPENFSVIYLKFKKRGQIFGYFFKTNANGIANSEDPDQTASLGAD